MPNTIPRDERDVAALEAVYSGSIDLPAPQLAVASAALAVALAEALTAQAEACECATSEGDLCIRCIGLSARAMDYRELARHLQTTCLSGEAA